MKDFLGFRFGNIHSKDLHLLVISSSNRYNKNLLPSPTDYILDIPGGDGKYYFGQTYDSREFTINVAFDNLDEVTWRRMAQLFSTDKLQDLVFDEHPYKTYKAKLKSAPDFKFVCFKDRETGQRIYKGEGTLNFICYHPLAFCFNKYVVRAADYYKCTMPQSIINKNSIEVNPYKAEKQPKILQGLIKDHYNVTPNMKTPWKGGYPSIEQVQWGELYYDSAAAPKMIIDVRDYWNNIPQWEVSAKLLTTPTLDYDQELIFMPQYSKVNYYNMDTGLNKQNGLIGSRLLVYNPGDVPIDFELKLGNLTSDFRSNLKDYTFRISRYNVERLSIEQAVDWIGLKTNDLDDNEKFKYGTKYFTIAEPAQEDSYEPSFRELKWSHPKHCYIAEPIPQEHLAHFIKTFYWQSNLLFNKIENGELKTNTLEHDNDFYETGEVINTARHIFNHEQGIFFANRYEELRQLCITDDERNELYWETLKVAILDRYKEFNEMLISINPKLAIFDETYTYEDFVYDYINKPLDYIRKDKDLNYGEFIFNITRMPQFYTFDYFDISSKDFDKIPYAKCGCDIEPKEIHNREMVLPLFLDSESRLLYNINEPKWENTQTFKKTYPEKEKNFFRYKPSKLIYNDNIQAGHWFQLPPGWSLIDISPVVDEDVWGGKKWLDARPFDWGKDNQSEDFRRHFNQVYRAAALNYLSQNCPYPVLKKYENEEITYPSTASRDVSSLENATAAQRKEWFSTFDNETLEDYMQFRRWYEDKIGEDGLLTKSSLYETYGNFDDIPYDQRVFSEKNSIEPNPSILLKSFGYELMQFRTETAEIGFLRTLANYWRANGTKGGKTSNKADVDDWWWYANDYIWANFPPLYWGYADLLNKAEIKYIPQFY